MRTVSVLTVLFVLVVFAFPADNPTLKAYNLTAAGYHALLFTSILPSLIVWYVGFFAYAKVYEYADMLKGSAEGDNFTSIAKGLKLLAWSLPVWLLVVLISAAIASNRPEFFPSSWVIMNYIQVVLPLIAFTVIGTASRHLLRRAKLYLSVSEAKYVLLAFVVGGAIYGYLMFSRLDADRLSSSQNIFDLPVWLVITTIILPHLYTWFIGLLACWEINAYGNKVSGVLYRQPFRLFVAGIILVIIGFVTFMYASSIELSSGYLKLGGSLVALQVFNLVRGAGFLLIAIGAARLKRIEEV